MCFEHDYDWHAEINNDFRKIADKNVKCDECPNTIKKGDDYRFIFQQESDGRCLCCDTYEKDECDCDEMNLGETYQHNICLDCQKFLDAIKEVELAEECKEYESQPPLGELHQALYDNYKWGDKKYVELAINKHPELKNHWQYRNVVE